MLSNDAHQGLQNGDIVYFLSDKNDPYCVRSIPSDQAERGSLHAFSPCEDGSVDASHQSCYLEVVRDGKWIGFRSMYAQNKFLQARRKGMNKLCFFNTNFGTWEQFELHPRDTDVTVSWSRLKLTFQSRRLSQFRIQVTVCRVGHFSGSKALYDPRHSMLSSKEDQRVVLSRVSDVMVKEWVRFVEREVSEREATEEKIELMRKDTKLLHQWTTNRLVELKDRAREDIGVLQEALDKTNAYARFKKEQLRASEEEIRSHCLVISDSVRRRRELRALVSAFVLWQKHTSARHLEHYAEGQATRIRARILVGHVFGRWRWHAAEEAGGRRAADAFRRRRDDQRAKAVLGEWSAARGRREEGELRAARLARRLELSRLGALVRSWLGLVAFRKRCEAGFRVHGGLRRLKERDISRATFSHWRRYAQRRGFHNHVVAAFAVRSRRKRLRACFGGIRAHAHAQVSQRSNLAIHSDKWRRLSQARAFRGWALAASISADQEARKVDYLHLSNLQSRPYYGWKRVVGEKKRCGRVVATLLAQHQCRLTRKAFGCWRDRCALRRIDDRRVDLVRSRRNSRLARRAVEAWAIHTAQVALRVAQFCEARRLARARSHFSCWRTLPAVNRAEVLRNDMSHAMARSVQRRRLGQILGSWAALCWERRRHKRICNIVRAHSERRHLRKFFSLWDGVRYESSAFAEEACLAFAVRKTRGVFASWLAFVARRSEERAALERCCRRLDRVRLRQCLRKWRRRVEVSCSQRRAAKVVRDRVDASVKLASFHAWIDTVVETRQCEELVEKLSRRFARALIARIFVEWRTAIGLVVHYRRTLDRFRGRREVRVTRESLAGWATEVTRKRALRRSERMLEQRLRSMRARRALSGWRARASEKTRMGARVGAAQGRRALRLKRECLRALAGHAWDKRAAAVKVQRFRSALDSRKLAGCYYFWLGRTVHDRRLSVVCNRLLERRAFILKTWAFDRWSGWIRSKQESLSGLRRCVKRKQVSLNFFLSWYWSALDDDVQFTLTNILHNASSDAEGFVGPEYKPLFSESGHRLRSPSSTVRPASTASSPPSRGVDLTVNPLASKNLLPRLNLESVRLAPDSPAAASERDTPELVAPATPARDPDSGGGAEGGEGGGETTPLKGTPPGLPGLDRLSFPSPSVTELRTETSSASVGLAELLHDEEDEQILAELSSPVGSLVHTPAASPLASPYRGKSRARKIEDFVASATFEVTDE